MPRRVVGLLSVVLAISACVVAAVAFGSVGAGVTVLTRPASVLVSLTRFFPRHARSLRRGCRSTPAGCGATPTG